MKKRWLILVLISLFSCGKKETKKIPLDKLEFKLEEKGGIMAKAIIESFNPLYALQ